MAGKSEKKTCFVVGPIGDDDSEDRIHADWLLEDIIEPVFLEHFQEFEVSRADKISNPGQINTQVITALLEADLVIADLTTLNPNAFYEIGIRHTIQKPIIHMHLEGQRIPFDIAPFRSIKFSRRKPADIRKARAALLEFVKESLDPAHEIDNPVTFSRGKLAFSEKATPPEKLVQDQLDGITERLLDIERHAQSGPRITVEGSVISSKVAANSQDPHIVVTVSSNGAHSALSITEAIARKAVPIFGEEIFERLVKETNSVLFLVPARLATARAMKSFELEMSNLGYSVEFS